MRLHMKNVKLWFALSMVLCSFGTESIAFSLFEVVLHEFILRTLKKNQIVSSLIVVNEITKVILFIEVISVLVKRFATTASN